MRQAAAFTPRATHQPPAWTSCAMPQPPATTSGDQKACRGRRESVPMPCSANPVECMECQCKVAGMVDVRTRGGGGGHSSGLDANYAPPSPTNCWSEAPLGGGGGGTGGPSPRF